MLEAAVQYWPIGSNHCACLLEAIAVAIAMNQLHQEGQEATQWPTACLHLPPALVAPDQAATEQEEEGPDDLAMDELMKFPAGIRTILTVTTGSDDLSAVRDETPNLPVDSNGKEARYISLINGWFSGVQEELYCAVDTDNIDICPGLVKSAARHVETYVQILMFEARSLGIGLSALLDKLARTVRVNPSEVPQQVKSALCDISNRVQVQHDKMCWHANLTGVLKAIRDTCAAGEGASAEFWALKSLAQLMDTPIYHGAEATVGKARQALLPGVLPLMTHPDAIEKAYLVNVVNAIKEAVQKHARAAHSLGKSLKAHLEVVADHKRGPGQEDMSHLIALLDRVGWKMSDAADRQVLFAIEAWSTLEAQSPRIALVMKRALMIPLSMGDLTYSALQDLFPGLPDTTGVSTLQQAAKLLKQIPVYKHLALKLNWPFDEYMEEMLIQHKINPKHQAARRFLVAVCKAANGIRVDPAEAKRMHISMCIKATRSRDPEASPSLELLDRIMDICTDQGLDSHSMRAIRQALPGALESLLRRHKWPDELPQDPSVVAVPGLQDAEASVLVDMFQGFLPAHNGEAATRGPTPQTPNRASSARPRRAPAQRSTGAEERPNMAVAEGAAAASEGRGAVEACVSRQQGNDRAADVAEGASNNEPAQQAGPSIPVQQQEAAKPESGLSKGFFLNAENAEKKRANKARQRAARAQAAAQTAEDGGSGGKEQGPAAKMGSAFKQQLSEEGKAAEQLLEAGQTTSDPKPATPMSPPIAGALTATNKAAASSNSSSISPQPPVQLRNGMSQAQQGPDLPRPAAPAAQSLDPAAQEGGPWQEAKASRRKTGSRQTASMAGARKGSKQDRGAPGQHTAGPSLSPLRAAQVEEADLPNEDNHKDDDDLCIVCWEQLREVIFCNCMHMCTCQSCARDIMATGALCPMCRTDIKSTITARF
ncbi:g5525 [Coccomyxa viridis]|uniref:G5525 protein n=1 Tax=Coccomyxa viridis TaxID=1274662 RepID=A0ABP1FZW2_9CHLO